MNPRSLEEDLLSIAGIEGAEVEGTSDKPAGLRIRIAEGADQSAVGAAIRRVLTDHGLGTDTRLPGESVEGSDAPHLVTADEPADAVGDLDDDAATASVAVLQAEDAEVIDLTDGPAALGEEAASDEQLDDPAEVPEPVVPLLDAEDAVEPAPIGAVARVASVAVEERRDGITVTVTSTDGTSIEQAAASSEGGVESAVIRASAQLARPAAPDAIVVDVDDRRVEGVDIVMIVLDLDGEMYAGSAIVSAGRSFALGRATWAALSL